MSLGGLSLGVVIGDCLWVLTFTAASEVCHWVFIGVCRWLLSLGVAIVWVAIGYCLRALPSDIDIGSCHWHWGLQLL